jgi:hypothetical protein
MKRSCTRYVTTTGSGHELQEEMERERRRILGEKSTKEKV